eukprot:CAMPEP_0204839056 /NCGR_PEP_ID=MMETSP1346-20131115/32919_1 /ASSEMBLY_ACC=CAM_ASM_000771 /TAXON_ID=215587 /ORGANISM="Aplanochytrium stocchinoi, Strain GSBS06" /LENGTH=454 /DNA_ID=CAMNT_0051975517 /DNA_START=95 /DNA_END=1459 /DNA_ORIENTATION=+
MTDEEAVQLEAEAQQEEIELDQAKQLKEEQDEEEKPKSKPKPRKSNFMLAVEANRKACQVCDKTVYATELIQVDDATLHKACFRCEECNGKLTLSNYASVNKKLYCKTHYFELFAKSGGSYEVFGDAGFEKKTGRSSTVGVVDRGDGSNKKEIEKTTTEASVEVAQEEPKPEKGKEETTLFNVDLKPAPKKKTEHAPAKKPAAPAALQNVESLLSKETLAKFTELNKSSSIGQKEFFQKRYIFTLQKDGCKEVADLASDFAEAAKTAGNEETFSIGVNFSQFINSTEKKYNKNFTSKKQRDAIFKELDLDGNGQVTFIEYLLHHYKPMMLEEYFKRMCQTPPNKLESVIGVIGNRKVVDILIEELFEPPAGADEKLDSALAAFIKEKEERTERIIALKDQLKTVGKVKGIGLQKELVTLEKEAEEHKDDVHVVAGIKRVQKKRDKLIKEIFADL